MGPDGDLVASRLARGCRCFVVRLDESIAGYGWLSTGPEWIGELQLEITAAPGEAYVWNCVTLPERRRQGVFRSVLAGIQATARREGLTRLWIGSVAIPAEKALAPAGFDAALRFSVGHLAGLHWMKAEPAPGADPSLVAAARTVLRDRDSPFASTLLLRRLEKRRH